MTDVAALVVDRFFGDVSTDTDEPQLETWDSPTLFQSGSDLPVLDMTREEAQACLARIQGTEERFWMLLKQMHDRRGWKALGFETWENFIGKHFAEARATIFRKIKAIGVREGLESAGVNVSLPDNQALLLSALPEEQRPEAIELAREIAAAQPAPVGKAALYRKQGQVSAAVIQQAVSALQGETDQQNEDASESQLETSVSASDWQSGRDEDEEEDTGFRSGTFDCTDIRKATYDAERGLLKVTLFKFQTLFTIWLTANELSTILPEW
jgi:hypothetical protein